MPKKIQDIELEAADWLVSLSEDPDDSEVQASFNAWLQRSDEHGRIWAEMNRLGQGLSTISPLKPEELPLSTDSKRGNNQNTRKLIFWGSGAALAASFAIAFLPSVALHLRADSQTKTAELKTLMMEDRSEVILAPESAIASKFSLDRREFSLLEGDAYFEVAPDRERPFVVNAAGVTITVLGTAFEVDQSDESIAISVSHGRVRVNSENSLMSHELKAGDRLVVDLGSEESLLESIAESSIAEWRNKRLTVQNRPVSEVVEALSPFYPGKIVLDADLRDKRVTGVYRLDKPLQTLKGLAKAHGGTVNETLPWVIFVGSGDP
ncbi:MAG: FecR domain-containing protein [Verrucomicrobiota bacterium]